MRLFSLLIGLLSIIHSYGQTESADPLRPPLADLPVANLEDAGFNQDSIAHLFRLIRNTPPNDFQGLVVIKNNQLVIEEYFRTYWRNSIHDIRSAGKSVTAMLLGIALKEGLVQDLEQSVYSFFPKKKYPYINEGLKRVRLKDLLDMSSGLDADTDDAATYGHVVKWIAKDDWKEYILQVPVTSKQGERWVYADINAVLIGLVIEEVSGMSLRDYAHKKLFAPLGIEQVYWYTNAAKQTGAAGNLYLSTLDFAKLGLVVLNEGSWKGTQFIDPHYIKELVAHKKFDLSPFADSYGMLWYKSSNKIRGKNTDYLFASGSGGNHLVVIPDEEMVIALTSSAYGRGPGQRRSLNILSRLLSYLE